MKKKKEMPVENYDKKKAEKAGFIVDVIEFCAVVCALLLTFLIVAVIKDETVVPILIFSTYVAIFVIIYIWEEWYCKRTHFSAYRFEQRRQENGITHCPYCGNDKLFDNDNGSFCGNCNRRLKIPGDI